MVKGKAMIEIWKKLMFEKDSRESWIAPVSL